MKVLFCWPNKDQFGFKPIGISLLSAILKQHGHEVALFDTSEYDFGFRDNTSVRSSLRIFKSISNTEFDFSKKKTDIRRPLLERLSSFAPDVIAVSALSDEIDIGLRISQLAKEHDPKVVVVWGNKAASMSPQKILNYSFVDYVCVGEGVEFITQFLTFLCEKSNPRQIRNLGFKLESGQLELNPIAPYFAKLDELPYLDWTIFDPRQFIKPYDGKLLRGGDHMIYWGCPNKCTYCINEAYREIYNHQSGFLRRYSVDRIIDELSYLKAQWNLEFFKFHDEDFCLKPYDYFANLAEKYRSKVNIPFTIMANAKNVTRDKVNLLKLMNCVSVTLGIETGNAKLRKEILNRNETTEQIVEAVSLFNSVGIRTSSFNMLGIPFETRETIFETIELNRQAKVRYPNVGFFYPLEGTTLRDIAINNGFFSPECRQVFTNDQPNLSFSTMTREELIALRERFLLYIKFPKKFWKFIELSEQPTLIGRKLTTKLFEIYETNILAKSGFWESEDDQMLIDQLEDVVANC